MTRNQRLMTYAGVLMLVNAALHLLAVALGGFASDALRLAPVGMLYALIGWGLIRTVELLAYIAFLACLIGGLIAYISMYSWSVPFWWVGLIILAHVSAAILLFLCIWRGEDTAASS